MFEVKFDGCCEPRNPGGHMGFAATIHSKEHGLIKLHGGALAAVGNTNNVAEYRALELALDWLIEQGLTVHPVSVYGDSKLVIGQMFGTWRIKHGAYAETARRVQDKLQQFSAIHGEWVPREQNWRADELSRRFLDTAPIGAVVPLKGYSHA